MCMVFSSWPKRLPLFLTFPWCWNEKDLPHVFSNVVVTNGVLGCFGDRTSGVHANLAILSYLEYGDQSGILYLGGGFNIPNAQCMVYLPTFTPKTTQM